MVEKTTTLENSFLVANLASIGKMPVIVVINFLFAQIFLIQSKLATSFEKTKNCSSIDLTNFA